MEPNKYKVRSEEAQEIIHNPPKGLLVWGGLGIGGLIFGLFILLNTLKVHETANIPITILPFPSDTSFMILSLNTAISKNIKAGQPARLSLNMESKQTINGDVAGVTFTEFNVPLILFRKRHNLVDVKVGMIGTLEIAIQKQSLFDMLFKSIFTLS
ncbi:MULTISPECIES: hypothetical protein [unclassified Chitinophaga]|uniref:hypothetical protein n=1 Tax=unclassified Chitinophaga TaxID=2619133 RepID=UPI0009D5B1CE|nr:MULTISPECIES: hypothetical protein [unclassified Chitinophaga]OMP75119.1 hypothetical protein BW716_31810 [[Flexibacter] sp. ATCC 35208]WPV66920.1 hypothetical protein QQL36_34575 [Chitinophaga sp. LS1]